MTREKLIKLLNNDDFENVKNKLCLRADLHALILLNQLQPGDSKIINGAGHDQICFAIDIELLASVITKEQVLDLRRCGVWYDEAYDSLSMFV